MSSQEKEKPSLQALWSEVARADQDGDHAALTRTLEAILAFEGADPKSKSMACINLAIVHDTQGRSDEAAAYYQRASGFAWQFFEWAKATEGAYLFEKGRTRESAEIFRALLATPWLDAETRKAYENNLTLTKEK